MTHIFTLKAKPTLTFTGLSVGVQAVASTTAAGSGLVAATQEAHVGASSWLSIRNGLTRVAPDCGQMRKRDSHIIKKPMKRLLPAHAQTPACESQDGKVPNTCLHMLTYPEKCPFTFWLSEFVVNTESPRIPQAS